MAKDNLPLGPRVPPVAPKNESVGFQNCESDFVRIPGHHFLFKKFTFLNFKEKSSKCPTSHPFVFVTQNSANPSILVLSHTVEEVC